MATHFHGSLSTFDATQEDWVEYAECLQHYFFAMGIDKEDVQHAILLTNVGPSTYRLAKTLSLPKKPTDYTFAELVQMVTAHFHPKPSPIMKRFEFNSFSGRRGECSGIRGCFEKYRRASCLICYGTGLFVASGIKPFNGHY